MRKLLQRLRPTEMSDVKANNDQLIAQEHDRLDAQLESLNSETEDYRQQSLQLKAAFNMLQVDSRRRPQCRYCLILWPCEELTVG